MLKQNVVCFTLKIIKTFLRSSKNKAELNALAMKLVNKYLIHRIDNVDHSTCIHVPNNLA